jgi:hypothetical protein
MKGRATADWLTFGPDNTGTLDVSHARDPRRRAHLPLLPGTTGLLAGMDAPIYTAPRFATGDERDGWRNKIQAVAKGSLDGTILTYEVYEPR